MFLWVRYYRIRGGVSGFIVWVLGTLWSSGGCIRVYRMAWGNSYRIKEVYWGIQHFWGVAIGSGEGCMRVCRVLEG